MDTLKVRSKLLNRIKQETEENIGKFMDRSERHMNFVTEIRHLSPDAIEEQWEELKQELTELLRMCRYI